jgi:hypothetical protein
MMHAKNKSISIAVLLGLITTFATGCYYYDRDDHWRYSRYRDGHYDSRYDRDRDRRYSRYDWDRDREWSYDRDRYSANPSRYHYND